MYPLVERWAPCRVCGSDRLRPLHVYKSRRKVTAEPLLALIGCEACGVVHSAPAPTAEELAAHYTEPEGWESRTPEDDDEVARKLRSKAEGYRRQLELLRPHLSGGTDGGPPRVLDFGCGLGAWLDVLQDAGWETYGIEPGAKQARVAARRHRMLDSVPGDERFDLVIVNHVLEHLLDPVSTLNELVRALRPGGQLFVSVPDFGRVHQHGDLPYVANDLHLNSFGFAGLRSTLALAGFEVEQHFEAPDWAALEKGAPTRLRVLARRSDAVRFPVEPSPLDQAVESLRELGRAQSREWWAAAGVGAVESPSGGKAEEEAEPRSAAGRGLLRRLIGRP